MELVHLVFDRRAVSVALLGHHVHHDRLAQFLGAGQDFFQCRFVMAVDESGVLDAETLEHGRRLQQLLEPFLHAVRGLVGRVSDEGQLTQQARDVVLDAFVSRVDAQLREVASEAADRRSVGPAVVVDHDDQVRRLEVSDLVQSLVGHSPRQGAVAYHRHDKTAYFLAQPRLRNAERIAQRGRGVAVLDEVVLRLLA